MRVTPQMAILIGKHDENQWLASNLYRQAAAGPNLHDQCPGNGEGIPWWWSDFGENHGIYTNPPSITTIVDKVDTKWGKKPWETLQHLQGIWLALREVVSAWFLVFFCTFLWYIQIRWNGIPNQVQHPVAKTWSAVSDSASAMAARLLPLNERKECRLIWTSEKWNSPAQPDQNACTHL
jgi:hypothetical protein